MAMSASVMASPFTVASGFTASSARKEAVDSTKRAAPANKKGARRGRRE
jgi:hypothetical protein